MTDRVENAITTWLSESGHTPRARALARRLWEPRAVVALALGSAAIGAFAARSALAPAAAPVPAAIEQPPTERAFAQPHHVLAEAIGPHHLRDRAEMTMRERGEVIASLEVDTALTYVAADELSARVESSAGDAHELVIFGGAIYVRPGYGPFHRRPPEPRGETRELADELASGPAAYVAALVSPRDGLAPRSHSVAGRSARAFELRGRDHLELPEWEADRVELTELYGEVVLDDETSGVLAVDLRAELAVWRGPRRLDLHLAFTRVLEPVAEGLAIEVPQVDDVVALLEDRDRHDEPRPPRGGYEP